MNRILVTGGSGFIGSNLITSLVENSKNIVLNIDIKEPKIENQKPNWSYLDIRNKAELKAALEQFKPNEIIHLAARTDLGGNTIEDYSTNTIGTENLVEVLNEINFEGRAIFTSSMYVCQPGYTPVDYEDYKPHTIYGESKVITEKIIKEKNPCYAWAIIRPTSIWGPYFGEPYNLFFKMILAHKYFHMGDKACKKTYGYIDNFIYQLKAIIDSNESDINKKTFYLGDYEPYDITSWADEIARYKDISIPNIPYFIFKLTAYFGDVLNFVGLKFPMTSFRLKNMTTNNILDLSQIKKIAPKLPVFRNDGTKATVDWIVYNEINNLK